jgi:hypothetical protein
MRAHGPNTRPGPRLRPRRATSSPRQTEWAVFSGLGPGYSPGVPPASLMQADRPSGPIFGLPVAAPSGQAIFFSSEYLIIFYLFPGISEQKKKPEKIVIYIQKIIETFFFWNLFFYFQKSETVKENKKIQKYFSSYRKLQTYLWTIFYSAAYFGTLFSIFYAIFQLIMKPTLINLLSKLHRIQKICGN